MSDYRQKLDNTTFLVLISYRIHMFDNETMKQNQDQYKAYPNVPITLVSTPMSPSGCHLANPKSPTLHISAQFNTVRI